MGRHYFDAGTTDFTQKLSEYAVGIRYDDLPDEVIERVRLMALHTLGVSLAAADIPLSKRAVKTASRINGGSGGKATAWLGGEKLSAPSAAFVNGTLADILDWEDCSWAGHPSAGVIPAALALAEELDSNGRQLIEALVAGYEVYLRVAMSVQPPRDYNHNKGWGLSSWQIFASAAAAAKLLGLDAYKTNQAYGLAALYTSIPSNLTQATMSDAYHYEQGQNAFSGILAAYNAESGIENLTDGLDIPYAFAEHLTSTPERNWLVKDLDAYLLLTILIKHWPANMWVQTPVEIVASLAREHTIDPTNIAEIVIDPPTQFRMHFYPEGFSSLMESHFSTPFVVASVLLDPTPGSNWYSPENLKDPTVLELAAKVKPGPSPEHTLRGSFALYEDGAFPVKTVTITLKDGTVYTRTQATHKGHPDDMLNRDEFTALFRLNASKVFDAEHTEKLIAYFLNMEHRTGAELGALLRP
ncbi:MAG: MmgE/PrpD family protein [Coriobacteriales bacterium]|jgi:2-methylcitrate dehydratase PrpD|nr:MmgE/PrpD family protein [Coriobacteriales bacterium]